MGNKEADDTIVFISFPIVENTDVGGTLAAIKKAITSNLCRTLTPPPNQVIYKYCIDRDLDLYELKSGLIKSIETASYIALGEGWREDRNCISDYKIAREAGVKCLEIKTTVTEV